MIFGDLEEEGSEVARLHVRGEAKPLKEHLKLNPSVVYIEEKPSSA